MMKSYPRQTLDPDLTTGLILCGMGGPDGPEAVEPFLRNLFQDPAIFPLPRIVAGLAGRMIAKRRAPKVRKRYARISKSSATPQLKITWKQAQALTQRMSFPGRSMVAGVAMRYWNPFPEEAIQELTSQGARQFLIVPAYPQYSGATGGSTITFVLDALKRLAPSAPVYALADWHLLPGYLDALARPVIEQLSGWVNDGIDAQQCALVYVAHSLPETFIRKGDPYLEQTQATIQGVHALVSGVLQAMGQTSWMENIYGGVQPQLVFQSKVGPIRWLGPQIDEEVPRLATAGYRRLMVQPVSFTCEHLETLLELDIELKELTIEHGMVQFQRGPALNLNERWLDSLANHLSALAYGAEKGASGLHRSEFPEEREHVT